MEYCGECPKAKDIMSRKDFQNDDDYMQMKSCVPNLFKAAVGKYPIKDLLKCSGCSMYLCPNHSERATENGKKYRDMECLLCDNCCWNELT